MQSRWYALKQSLRQGACLLSAAALLSVTGWEVARKQETDFRL